MKNLIRMIGLLTSLTAVASAEDLQRMPMQDFLTTDMDYIFEVKTNKFDKVILDCQSFITGMSFSNGGVEKSNIFLDIVECGEVLTFLEESKRDNLPVCIGLDSLNNEIEISRDDVDECI